MFNPIKASENIKEEFTSYIATSFHLSDADYAKQFKNTLDKEGTIAKGPYLDIGDSFETGENIEQLIREGEMSPLFQELEKNIDDGKKEIKLKRPLYLHQERAIRKINANKNLVVTTGTGSGKTECFMLPIINYLLREKENGLLCNGVRAILIYPMNALANDQMKRLRLILKDYPDITFGVYNSSTKHETAAGIAEYGRIFKDENGHALKPLKNEVISRKDMQTTPPHILVTNYAMLEYMMLRPNDDLVFSKAKLKFLVLDEAHIYRGATGIETSLLLRRLKARISDPMDVLHILTSATLGGEEANKDIITFASTLCEANFDEADIIRSKTVMPDFPTEIRNLSMDLFAELANPIKPLNTILSDYGIIMDFSLPDAEILYNLCLSSKVYRILREIVTKPMTVQEITHLMRTEVEVTEEDVINLISVAAQAEKNKSALIKARYHMFVRALEGAYITIDKEKHLYLTRKNYVELSDDTYKVFEGAVCDDCGRIGIAGKIVNGRLEFASDIHDAHMEIYLLGREDEQIEEEEEEEEDSNDIQKNDFLICSKCGEILHESQKYDFKCGHGSVHLIKIRKAERKGTRNEAKCPGCNLGHMKLFYIGYDAATAVLGTELYEQLPESELKLQSRREEVTPSNNLFAAAVTNNIGVDVMKKKRQFLAFSDSRGEAAFYACYMTSFYKEFLRRRGIWHVIEKNKDSISRHPWEVFTLVEELTSYFDTNRTFAEAGDNGSENLTPISKRQAWIAVLNEMVNARRSTSLVSLGILDFEYKGNSESLMKVVADKYHQTIKDMKALFDLLVMDIVYIGAVEGEDCLLTNDEREYIYYGGKPRRIKKCKESESDKRKNYLHGWIPRVRKSGISFKNGRMMRLLNILDISEEEAKGLLAMYWDAVLVGGDQALTPNGEGEYYISTDRFIVRAGSERRPIYVCTKCGKTTMINCKGKCVSIKCDGRLKEISHSSLIEDNHYAKLYSSNLMEPLHIKEHTAQLGRAEQQTYQEMFIKKDINALSCSTTFEMGVDVGDLETVYLRNMPPSPANYVQRAGRAGRSIHAAAYSLTYAKLGSHDFTYFKHPERMISGKIGVPLFSISNEKVVLRHIFAVALSDFFSNHEEVYNQNNADVLLNGEGFELLIGYLEERPQLLKKILLKSIPKSMHEKMGIVDYTWPNRLVGEDGVLRIAVEDFRKTVKWYENEFKRLKRSGDIQAAAKCERQLKEFRKGKEDQRGRNELIEFLVRNNVLPKYGFPVDTVELHQGMDSNQEKRLQMIRDLQLAVAEYAPDAQVVADGRLYTSRYIRKLPQTTGQDWVEVYIATCSNPSCKTWNHRITEPSDQGELCVSCHGVIEKNKWKKAIEPRKGFIAESKTKDVPLRKPDKSYRSDDYYIGDAQRQIMVKHTYMVNGEFMIQMETSSNDSLMVVCDDEFFVCNHCGYAISSTAEKDEKDFNSYAISYGKPHYSPWGKPCSGKLYKRNLCHSFKTDVVKIVFGTPRAKNWETMLSVMYALLEAVSNVLDIERTDIRGCLYKVRYKRSLVYSVILYDAVAGGAGHVRRLVTDDCGVFQRIIKTAIDITKNCTCKPSCYNCLRNYYNRTVHDKLSRVEAYNFLESFYGMTVSVSNENFEETNEIISGCYTEDKIILGKGSLVKSQYKNWNEFIGMIGEYAHVFADFDNYHIPLPTEAYSKCRVLGTDSIADVLLLWRDDKIMIFEEKTEMVGIQGWKSLHIGEISPSEIQNIFSVLE